MNKTAPIPNPNLEKLSPSERRALFICCDRYFVFIGETNDLKHRQVTRVDLERLGDLGLIKTTISNDGLSAAVQTQYFVPNDKGDVND